ncbi:MAG TPA: hypothetical protein VGO77_03345, partial [Mycobacterium sp.]|nr:hypothetical protein [Mycobacterium sp.]
MTSGIGHVAGNEDIHIALGIMAAFEADADAKQTVTIAGLPTSGVTLSNTAHDVLTVTDGSITLTPAQLAGLALVSDGETQHFDLTVTATVIDGETPGTPLDPLQTATVAKTLHVDVTPVAETPNLNVPTVVLNGDVDQPISLGISAALTEVDDPDSLLSILIDKVPPGVSLNHGAIAFTDPDTGFTAWAVDPADLADLTVKGDGTAASFTLHVTASASDGTATPASISHDIAVTVGPVGPTFTVHDASGLEDTAIPLSISMPVVTETNDPDAFVTSLTIGGIPSDATLANSSGALSFSNGSITFTAQQLAAGALNGLTITPTSADGVNPGPGTDPKFTLTVSAITTDGPDHTATSHPLTVTVVGDADAPVLNPVLASTGPHGEANADSSAPLISDDGRYVVFTSSATNLTNLLNAPPIQQIYREDLQTGEIVLVSGSANASALNPSISADGVWVVFESRATNLAPPGTLGLDGSMQVYAKNVATGELRILSAHWADPAQTQFVAADNGGAFISSHALSADGRYVVITSMASNLIPGLNDHATILDNGSMFVADSHLGVEAEVFRVDLGGQTDFQLVSSDSAGRASVQTTFVNNTGGSLGMLYAPAADIDHASISADGREVAFYVDPSRGDGVSNSNFTIIRDLRVAGPVVKYMPDMFPLINGAVTSTGSAFGAISGDGAHIAYFSPATNGLNFVGIYVHDVTTGRDTLVSTDASGNPLFDPSGATFSTPSMSTDGRFVVFTSNAHETQNIQFFDGIHFFFQVSGASGSGQKVFVKDLLTGALTVVASNGSDPSVSDAGLVAFDSSSGTLAPGAPGDHTETFVSDLHIRAGAAGNPIPLAIMLPQLGETGAQDPDASLTITISGIPPDAVLSDVRGVTYAVANGSYTTTIDAASANNALAGLMITPGAADQPGFTLHVTVTAKDGTASATSAEDITIAVAPPLMVSGVEDHTIALPSLTSMVLTGLPGALTSPSPRSNVTISGIPDDAVLIVTEVVRAEQVVTEFHPTAGSVTLDFAAVALWHALDGLAIRVTAADEPGFTLHVSADYLSDFVNGQPVITSAPVGEIKVVVQPDAPILTLQDASGSEDQPIPINIAVAPGEVESSPPAVSLVLSGIPSDAVLSNRQGALTVANGSITFSAQDIANGALNGLAITPTSADGTQLTLHATATADDGRGSNTTKGDIHVVVAGHSEVSLTVAQASGSQNLPIPLSITALFQNGEVDPDAVGTLKISGIPDDARLSNHNGTLSFANGSITFTGQQVAAGALDGLTITPTSNDGASGGFVLHVTATSTDGSAAPATVSRDLAVTVAVAGPEDQPILLPGLFLTHDVVAGTPTDVMISGLPADAKLFSNGIERAIVNGAVTFGPVEVSHGGLDSISLQLTSADDPGITLHVTTINETTGVATTRDLPVTILPHADVPVLPPTSEIIVAQTNATAPTLTADGRFLFDLQFVFINGGFSNHLVKVDTLTGTVTDIPSPNTADRATPPSVSADGHFLAYYDSGFDQRTHTQVAAPTVYVIDTESGATVKTFVPSTSFGLN